MGVDDGASCTAAGGSAPDASSRPLRTTARGGGGKGRLMRTALQLLIASAMLVRPASGYAVRIGGSSVDVGNDIAVDSSGAAFVTGSFDSSMTVGGTPLTIGGARNTFVAKLGSTGAVEWATSFSSAGDFNLQNTGYGIAVDSLGAAYVIGQYNGNMTAGAIALPSRDFTDFDVYVAKLSSTGVVLWAIGFPGTGTDQGQAIAVGPSDEVYVVGYFEGILAVGSFTLTSSGGQDVFVAKLSSAGAVLWAVSFPGTSSEYGNSIAVDASGAAFVTGFFEGSITIGATTLTSPGIRHMFVAKLNSTGGAAQAIGFGGSLGGNVGRAIAVDSSGGAYVTGNFAGPMTVGGITLSGSSVSITFVVKLSSNLTVAWARSFPAQDVNGGYGIAADSVGAVYVGGFFQGSMAVGEIGLTSTGRGDAYVAKLSSTGAVTEAASFLTTALGLATARALVVDPSGRAVVVGDFEGSLAVGSTTLSSAGSKDVFVLTAADGPACVGVNTTAAALPRPTRGAFPSYNITVRPVNTGTASANVTITLILDSGACKVSFPRGQGQQAFVSLRAPRNSRQCTWKTKGAFELLAGQGRSLSFVIRPSGSTTAPPRVAAIATLTRATGGCAVTSTVTLLPRA